jgi:hypothetical protein
VIPILLYDLRWRLLVLVGVSWLLYLGEPGFHQHGALPSDEAIALGPVGVSATLSYFAGLAMIVLLAGFVSNDRREGYSRIFLSHPTRPLAFYGLQWVLALAIALLGAAAFLVLGQMVAWGEVRGGWSGLLLALVSAIVYGGLMAFLSSALPRGDTLVALLLFLPTFVPQLLGFGLASLPPAVRQAVLLLMPPHGALQVIWQGLLQNTLAWGAIAFGVGYGVVWLLAGVALLRLRDWP